MPSTWMAVDLESRCSSSPIVKLVNAIATHFSAAHNLFMGQVTISVRRSPVEVGEKPRFETHQVEVTEKASILDAVFALQRGPCPDLAFRFSCRVGMCGSCAMVVNGRERLTCSTLVNTIGDKLRLEPLRNFTVVKDLAVKVERTEHLLNQSEERLELVIQGSNDGFWDGRVLPNEPWNSPRSWRAGPRGFTPRIRIACLRP